MTEMDYEWQTGKCAPPDLDQEPPLSQAEFRDLLRYCSPNCLLGLFHTCKLLSPQQQYFYERLPKKKTSWEVKQDRVTEAWGLQCFYALSFARLVLLHVLILAGPFAVWG